MGNCPSESLWCPFFTSYWTNNDMRLPALGADPESLTFSGFSSGSFMTSYMSVIYSKSIKGVGLVGGGPYGTDVYDVPGTQTMWQTMIGEQESQGLIDPSSNLKDRVVTIYYGSNDQVITSETTLQQAELYKKFEANVKVTESTYRHVWPIDREPTEAYPKVSCEEQLYTEIQNCGDDYTGKILRHLYETLDPDTPFAAKTDYKKSGILKLFDQREFLDETNIFQYNGFDNYGYVFYPDTCVGGAKKCKIHVHIHGCGNSAATRGEDLIRNSDYLEYAAANDMIVIFPQNMYDLVMNPFSCWATGPSLIPNNENYNNQNGLQPKVIMSMVERVLSPQDSATYDYLANNIAGEEPEPLSQNFLLGTWYYLKNFWYHMLVAFFYALAG